MSNPMLKKRRKTDAKAPTSINMPTQRKMKGVKENTDPADSDQMMHEALFMTKRITTNSSSNNKISKNSTAAVAASMPAPKAPS